jgi:hypothetical protein
MKYDSDKNFDGVAASRGQNQKKIENEQFGQSN